MLRNRGRGAMTTIENKVLHVLKKGGRVCDDCLSDVTGVEPRQSINQACRRLHSQKLLSRPRESCSRCGIAKTLNVLPSSGSSRQRAPMKIGRALRTEADLHRSFATPAV